MTVKPYFRAMELEGITYKGDKERSDSATERLKSTDEFLPEFTDFFTSWAFDGLEADDLIAFGIKRYYHRFDKIIVHSSDTDPYQCFRKDDAKLCFWRNQKQGLFTYADFVETTGYVDGEEWLAHDAITGGHNGMRKGIKGYGDKKTKELIKNRTTTISNLMYIYGEASLNYDIMQLPHRRIDTYRDQIRLNPQA